MIFPKRQIPTGHIDRSYCGPVEDGKYTDVYMYEVAIEHTDGEHTVECCHCSLEDKGVVRMNHIEAYNHLVAHKISGHWVPYRALARVGEMIWKKVVK